MNEAGGSGMAASAAGMARGETGVNGVTLSGIVVRYGEVTALDRVSLDVRKGEMFLLLGPSGCGKSTLLRAVAGFAALESGSVSIGGRIVNDVPPHLRNTGMVFQNYALFPHLTAAENVAFGLRSRGVPEAERESRVKDALRMVGLEGLGGRKPGELSGGQQQRVALARALVIRPEVLLLDEPLSNLDARLRMEMREEIRHIHRSTGITTLYVTHDQREAMALADRIAVLDRGRVVATGAPEELYYDPPNRFAASFLGDMNMVEGRLSGDGQVETPFGTVRCARVGPAAGRTGGRLRLFCRPECVRLLPPDAPAPAEGEAIQVSGVVAARAFQGDHCVFSVRIATGETWIATTASPRKIHFREKDAVACRVNAEDMAELRDG
ncbi:MAG: ABC transporter ATP-binding protein [Planctomycetota bacterium]|nr:ABC transporter ATP-binding protein [Planctomycetota bacterium]